MRPTLVNVELLYSLKAPLVIFVNCHWYRIEWNWYLEQRNHLGWVIDRSSGLLIIHTYEHTVQGIWVTDSSGVLALLQTFEGGFIWRVLLRSEILSLPVISWMVTPVFCFPFPDFLCKCVMVFLLGTTTRERSERVWHKFKEIRPINMWNPE